MIRPIEVSTAEQRELAIKAHAGDRKAQDRLVRGNMGFVHKLAYRLSKYATKTGLTAEDLVIEGASGLVEAIRRYDSERDVNFLTYAQWWVRARMLNAIRDNASMLTGYGKNKRFALNAAWHRELRMATLRGLSTHEAQEEFARNHKLSPTALGALRDLESSPASLDVLMEMEVEPGNTNDGKETQEEIVSRKQVCDQIYRVINTMELTVKERAILDHRLLSDEKSLKDIGDEMGISRERVRQIEVELRRKLHKMLSKHLPAEVLP